MSMTGMISNKANGKQDTFQEYLTGLTKPQGQTQDPDLSANVKNQTVVASGGTNERKQKKAPGVPSAVKLQKKKTRRAGRRSARESIVQRMRKFLCTDDEIERGQISEDAVMEDALRWMKGAVPMEELSRLMAMTDEAAENPRIWMAGSNGRVRR
ncbi:hypothetical protein EWM64_g9919 [Hericium alpestre]|uniref:Uncharacterized protein n=1 Tax=Hericium alpestre TaxID=135208 RepID=A0A4Y9ZJM7_9AGAM|nr:hypothetical protein EWM64_g9919 [Hericium alpestre]